MVISCYGSSFNNDRGNPPRKVVPVMKPSIPGGRVVREYVPPHLRDAMYACRLANAYEMRTGRSKMRYVLVCNVHEGIDPEQPLRILDTTVAEQRRRAGESSSDADYIHVAELLNRLPEDLRKRVLHS